MTRAGSVAANLATSTWMRWLDHTHGLVETVDLDGDDSGISDEEPEQFIANFPIDPRRLAGAR